MSINVLSLTSSWNYVYTIYWLMYNVIYSPKQIAHFIQNCLIMGELELCLTSEPSLSTFSMSDNWAKSFNVYYVWQLSQVFQRLLCLTTEPSLSTFTMLTSCAWLQTAVQKNLDHWISQVTLYMQWNKSMYWVLLNIITKWLCLCSCLFKTHHALSSARKIWNVYVV